MSEHIQNIARKSSFELLYSIVNSQIREYPYPHSFLSEIFEPETLAALNRHFPRDNELLPLGDAIGSPNHKADNLRSALNVADKSQLERLDVESRAYWSTFHDFFSRDITLTHLLSKYRSSLLLHPYGELILAPDTKLKLGCYLQSDSPDFSIEPHTQDPSEALVILI